MQITEFANRLYVNKPPSDSADLAWRDKPMSYYWYGALWIVHPNLPGVGTNNETCFCYHKSAIGHAVDTAGLESEVDYNREQAYSWARASMNMGAKVLQNSGIVLIAHDGSALS